MEESNSGASKEGHITVDENEMLQFNSAPESTKDAQATSIKQKASRIFTSFKESVLCTTI